MGQQLNSLSTTNKPIKENEINYNIKPCNIYLGIWNNLLIFKKFMYYLNNFKMKIEYSNI